MEFLSSDERKEAGRSSNEDEKFRIELAFLEKLYDILDIWNSSSAHESPVPTWIDEQTPVSQVTDEELIKRLLRIMQVYYRQWKLGSMTEEEISGLIEKGFIKKFEPSPKGTKDTTNQLLVKNLLDLADKRIADLDDLLQKKIELFKSI